MFHHRIAQQPMYKKMKRKLKLFKSWYAPLTIKQFIPNFKFSKNVQGWFFTRNWSLCWLRYCLLFTVTITSDFNEDRRIAHEKNVARYLHTQYSILNT